MIRKSGISNGFSFYALLSLFFVGSLRSQLEPELPTNSHTHSEFQPSRGNQRTADVRHVQCGTLRRRTGHARRRRSSSGGSGSRTCVYATCGTHSTTYPLPPLHPSPLLSLLPCSLLADRINPSANYACSLIISPRQIRIVIIFKWPLALPPLLLYSSFLFDISGTVVVVVYTFHMLRKSLLQL